MGARPAFSLPINAECWSSPKNRSTYGTVLPAKSELAVLSHRPVIHWKVSSLKGSIRQHGSVDARCGCLYERKGPSRGWLAGALSALLPALGRKPACQMCLIVPPENVHFSAFAMRQIIGNGEPRPACKHGAWLTPHCRRTRCFLWTSIARMRPC